MKVLGGKIGEIQQDFGLGEDFWVMTPKHSKPKKSEDTAYMVAVNAHT